MTICERRLSLSIFYQVRKPFEEVHQENGTTFMLCRDPFTKMSGSFRPTHTSYYTVSHWQSIRLKSMLQLLNDMHRSPAGCSYYSRVQYMILWLSMCATQRHKYVQYNSAAPNFLSRAVASLSIWSNLGAMLPCSVSKYFFSC